MLELRGVTKRFGGIVAVNNLTMHLEDGEILGLIGPNGSGKTVTINLCTGVYPPTSGTVTLDGAVLDSLKQWEINGQGLSRTFQTTRLWGRMSVLENIMTSYVRFMSASFWSTLARFPSARKEERRAREASFEVLTAVGMTAFADKPAGDLSFGQQRLVELARALVSQPKCILLDEPAAGLKAGLIVQLGELLQQLNHDRGIAFLVVEHRIKLVMDTCSRVVVLEHGEKIAEGPPSEVQEDERVITAYLGRRRAGGAKGGSADADD